MNTSKSLQLNQRDKQHHLEQAQPSLAMRSFTDYYLGTIFRPRRTFDALLTDRRRLRFGLLALAANAVLYTLVYVFLSLGGGAPSSFSPWLAIPVDVYYYYNPFFLAPSMFMGWILAAGVALNSPTIWRAILLSLYTLSILWFMMLFPKAIGSAQRIQRGPAVFVGVLAYLVYQGVFVIFNR